MAGRFVPWSAFVWVLLSIAAGQLPGMPASRPAAGSSPVISQLDSGVVATYTGGAVTESALREKLRAGICAPRSLCTFKSHEEMVESLVRSMAIREILLQRAEVYRLSNTPEWFALQKLFEERALVETLLDVEAWEHIKPPTDEQIRKFDHSKLEMFKTREGVMPGIPGERDMIVWILRKEESEIVENQLREMASSQFPLSCFSEVAASPPAAARPVGHTQSATQPAAIVDLQHANVHEPVFACGAQVLTREDLKLLSGVLGGHEGRCAELENLRSQIGDDFSGGELARARGYAGHPRFARQLKELQEQWLVQETQKRIRAEWEVEFVPSDAEVVEYYEKEFKEQQDASVRYDAIVVPVTVEADADDGQREKARFDARTRAGEVIEQIRQGADFNRLLAARPEYRHEPPQGRLMTADATGEFVRAVANVVPGAIAPVPVEEFGGFAIIRVLELVPARKMPLEYVRGNIREKLISARRAGVQFEETLLSTYRLMIDRRALTRVQSQGE